MATPLKDVLAQLIIRRGYGRQLDQQEIEQAWLAMVGDVLSHCARPRQPYRGTVEIIAKNSTVLQELTFRKLELLQKFQETLPEKKICDLRFRVGNL